MITRKIRQKNTNKCEILICSFLILFWFVGCNEEEVSVKGWPLVQADTSDLDAIGPIEVDGAESHSCIRYEEGGIKCWGTNTYIARIESETDSNLPLAKAQRKKDDSLMIGVSLETVNSISNSIGIATGMYHTCSLISGGKVKCWGMESSGQLGNGENSAFPETIPVTVQQVGGGGELSGVTQITIGGSFTCALLNNGQVNCWGSGVHQQLGQDNDINDKTTPVVVQGIGGTGNLSGVTQIYAGDYDVCAILENTSIVCWGDGGSGQLGDGTNNTSGTPVVVQNIGGGGTLTGATNISAGWATSCAVINDGSINCWGWGNDGNLGNSGLSNSSTPVEVFGITSAIQVKVGTHHVCALLDDGQIKCWGSASNGELGIPESSVPASLHFNTPVTVNGISTAVAIGLGFYHSCAIVEEFGDEESETEIEEGAILPTTETVVINRSVYCWGYGENGQLGENIYKSYLPIKVEDL